VRPRHAGKSLKGSAKRLRKILSEHGIEMRHVQCLELAARLLGFDNWRHNLDRDLDVLQENDVEGPLKFFRERRLVLLPSKVADQQAFLRPLSRPV
jgi:hypothetical protein